ncbi:MAG: AbrB family transcriptional regulator, partial [Staphylococcus epidermidis]|nr:AbrB family transcriptional regulator [Staphylococcus epidermidis]
MKRNFINNLIILLIAIMLSLLLKMLHVILPFMFGPILAALLCVKVLKLKIRWPFWLSQIGLILLGVQIGSTFTQQVIKDISKNWLTIVFVTILLILLALIIAFFFKKIAQVNLETAILSVIPGALSQMLVMAEENKKANILVVSLTQTSRVIFVVILVPLISYFFQDNHHEMNHTTMEVPTLSQTLNIWQIIILFSMVGIIYIGMSKINFPTKQLLAPIIVLIIWNMTTHLTFSLDHWLLATAQLIYMIRIGLQIANLMSDLKGRIAIAIAFQNIMLIVTTFIMIIGIHLITNESINELFLGAAPGGMSQIVLVAMATGADVAMISSYHIFRIFFILFVI